MENSNKAIQQMHYVILLRFAFFFSPNKKEHVWIIMCVEADLNRDHFSVTISSLVFSFFLFSIIHHAKPWMDTSLFLSLHSFIFGPPKDSVIQSMEIPKSAIKIS